MPDSTHFDRRQFLQIAGAGIAGAILQKNGAPAPATASAPATNPATRPASALALPKIQLGRTGRMLPRLGIGCFEAGNLQKEDEGVAVLRHAIQSGIRYLDTAPSYNSGVSERRVGIALRGENRKEFYVATKTLQRDAGAARRELEESLKRLDLQYVNCLQIHEIHDDLELLFRKESVLTAMEKAREEGLLRNIGITRHRDPAYITQCVERYEFVSGLVPVNPIDTQHLSFVNNFLPVAAKRGVAVIAMKIFGGGKLIKDGALTAKECLRYAAATSATILVPGCETVAHVDEAVSVILETASPGAAWMREMEKKAGPHLGKQSEWYKN